MAWHPRGELQWPTWREAVAGRTRVEHVRSGATGTFVRWPKIQPPARNPGYAVIDWDNGYRGRVVAFAFDLREMDNGR